MIALSILAIIVLAWIAYSAYFASKVGDAPLVEFLIGVWVLPLAFAIIAYWGLRVRILLRLVISVIAGLLFLFSFETMTRFGANLGYPFFHLDRGE
ncbi:MAG: hypothetical protein ACRBBQ_17360 [Cognatishimia sp.]